MRWVYGCVLFFSISLYAEMSDHVFVVSEWLPKEGKDQELWQDAKRIMALTLQEEGCVGAHAVRQITHPGSPGKSKYTLILLQEYRNVEAFDIHCQSDYVTQFFERKVQDQETGIVEEWTCRLFNEGEP